MKAITESQEETEVISAIDGFNSFLESCINRICFGKFTPTSLL